MTFIPPPYALPCCFSIENYEMVKARSKDTSFEDLSLLSKSENSFTRINVANNPNTPIEILIELSKDEDEYVRGYVIQARINRMSLLK